MRLAKISKEAKELPEGNDKKKSVGYQLPKQTYFQKTTIIITTLILMLRTMVFEGKEEEKRREGLWW